MIALYWKLLLTVGQIRLNYIKLSARIACRGTRMIALYWKLLLTVGQIRLNYIKLSARIACRGTRLFYVTEIVYAFCVVCV